MTNVIDCSIPCHQIIKMLTSCPSKRINFSNPSSSDIKEIIMVFLSTTPYPLSFIILLTGTYYRSTRSIFILAMTFIQNFIVEMLKNNLKDPRPNYKCNQQYGNPSNHTVFLTSVIMWFIMDGLFTAKQYQLRKKKFLVPLFMLYPFIVYSRVYLNYHSIEQMITGLILGTFIGIIWYILCTKVILSGDNVFKNLLKKLNVVNTLTADSIGFGSYNRVFSEDKNLEKKYHELLQKNQQLSKLKEDLRRLTKNMKNMEFMKNGQNDLAKMMEMNMGMNGAPPNMNNPNSKEEEQGEEEEEEYEEEYEEEQEEDIKDNTNQPKFNINKHQMEDEQ